MSVGEATGPTVPVAREPDLGWQRFHPLTPVLRGGVIATAVAGYVISQQTDRLFGGDAEDPTGGHLYLAGALVAALVLLVVAGSWLTWRAARFRLGERTVELKTGIVFRQHRQVRYDRIQAVDITRPLLARLAGLTAVKVEAAGGSDSNIELAYLAQDRAGEVRIELLNRAARAGDLISPIAAADQGASDASGGLDPGGAEGWAEGGAARADGASSVGAAGSREAPLRLIAAIPSPRVWVAAGVSFETGFLVIGIPALIVALLLRQFAVLPWLGPMVLGAGAAFVKNFTTWMNFRVEADDRVIRVRHGLTELRTSTMPLHRIQAVEVKQPMLWRPLDWWRITVNVAGVHQEPGESGGALIPVGTREEVLAILAAMGPRWSLPEVVEGFDAPGPSPKFTGAPRAARWLDPLSWRRIGFCLTPTALVTRGGRLGRWAQLVPHARVQSVTMSAGPLQRRLGLASVQVLSTSGSVDPGVSHLDLAVATELFAAENEHARRARHAEEGPPAAPRESSAERDQVLAKAPPAAMSALRSGSEGSPASEPSGSAWTEERR